MINFSDSFMTVGELIKRLQKVDPELEVLISIPGNINNGVSSTQIYWEDYVDSVWTEEYDNGKVLCIGQKQTANREVPIKYIR